MKKERKKERNEERKERKPRVLESRFDTQERQQEIRQNEKRRRLVKWTEIVVRMIEVTNM